MFKDKYQPDLSEFKTKHSNLSVGCCSLEKLKNFFFTGDSTSRKYY